MLKVDNLWDEIVEGAIVEESIESITVIELGGAIRQMESGKANRLIQLVGEIIRFTHQVGVMKIAAVCDVTMADEKVQRDWKVSTFITINKAKCDPL